MKIGSKSLLLNDSRLVTFRPVNPDDESFLLTVYGSTREEELALVNWELPQREAFLKMQVDAQNIHYRKNYPGGEHYIILDCGQPVGRLYVAEIDMEFRILDITILPEHRGKGIGTAIVKELTNETAPLGKPLRIYVESFNRSYRLFERLGFTPAGENGYSVLMAWGQSSAAQAP